MASKTTGVHLNLKRHAFLAGNHPQVLSSDKLHSHVTKSQKTQNKMSNKKE